MEKVFSFLALVLFIALSATLVAGSSDSFSGDYTASGMAWWQWVIVSAVITLLLSQTFYIVHQQTVGVIERFGKFQKMAKPGLGVKIPFVDSISERLSLRVLELCVELETKTEDDVFVEITTEVMYEVIEGEEYTAAYKLTDPESQIDAYVNDILRAKIPTMSLDETFKNKEELNKEVKESLEESMTKYGFNIVKTLITDIEPDKVVKTSMNTINAAERQKTAARYEAEALIIKRTGEGEAESAFKRLQGEGMSDQRIALAAGIRDSLNIIQKAGASPEEANVLMVLTQHYDTLQSLGGNKANLILFDGSAGGSARQFQEMTAAFHVGGKLQNKPRKS